MKSFFPMVGFADGCFALRNEGCDFVARVVLCTGLGRVNVEILK